MFQAFTLAFSSMCKQVEGRFGKIRTLESDEDTAFLKSFQRHLDARGIRRQTERRYQKNSVTERIGGLFKRHLSGVARQEGVPWHDAIEKAVWRWNNTYVSKLRAGPPSRWGYKNFDKLIERLYELEPIRFHALYNIGSAAAENELGHVFKYKKGDKVVVSLRTINKKLSSPVSLVQHIF
jgi:hypothetical protein